MKIKQIFATRFHHGIPLTLCLLLSFAASGQQNARAGYGGTDPDSSANVASSSNKSADVAGSRSVVSQTTGGTRAPDESYRIGVDDELMISVWHEAELSGPVVVRPDGIITLPLLNEVHVVGLSTKELQELLTEGLKAYLAEPQVTVIVRAIHSRKVFLMGEVNHPGAYPLSGTTTVLQLLAQAGGLKPYAKTKSIYVLRDRDGQHTRIAFNYKKALSEANAKSDLVLQPEDMVVVP